MEDEAEIVTDRKRVTPTLAMGVAAVVIAYGIVAAQLEPFSRPSEIANALAIAAIVALAIATGWHRKGPVGPLPPAHGPQRNRGLAVWVVLIVAIGLFQLAQFQSNPRNVYPTLSSLASIAFGEWPVRAAAIAGWLALGIYIVGPRPGGVRR
jgi:hypothetical protein